MFVTADCGVKDVPLNILVPFLSGLATGLGGVFSSYLEGFGQKGLSLMLGAAAGIGFTIVFFDLLPSSVHIGSYGLAAAGFISGILLGRGADILLPHMHLTGACPTCSCAGRPFISSPLSGAGLLKTAYLMGLGVALHNLPEGLAIGAGFEADHNLGLMLALAIGVHNIPEGMALAGLLRAAGQGRVKSVFLATAAGLFIPMGAYISRGIVISDAYLSLMLALGAGTMLYVVWSELIPESCKMHKLFSRLGVAGGFLLSMAVSISR